MPAGADGPLPTLGARWALGAAAALVRHPGLWPTAAVVAVRLADPGWWRRWPPLPLPPPAYARFRLQTIYGGDGTVAPDPADLLAYLRWCRAFARR